MMRSKSCRVDLLHEPYFNTPTKLSLLNSRPIFMPPEEASPPQTEVSVPFMWEEAPGKPRRCHTQSEPNNNSARTLELPPRLSFLEGKVSSNMEVPSPTTVLGGPYVGRTMSYSSSCRTHRDYWNSNFGSTRWSGSRKMNKETEGSLDFSCPITLGSPQPNKGKFSRVHTRGSLFSLSLPKARSHFWGSIYESFKHVVPWKNGQEKHRKWGSKFDNV
ncbi:PREDICTED: uncharacterized protein LOC109337272 isoform X1 [Lupinus angustifolius]|uniref:uncharacterized protein LOC109337272 isoform X1 n=1 Tax=Lupinus angustifolius TaxID=3871 RepID=UPI00092EB1FC|nr:PREDICTED: uncharacterized protein LOC109337272 isoform X1 [Lupinus angustifolius]